VDMAELSIDRLISTVRATADAHAQANMSRDLERLEAVAVNHYRNCRVGLIVALPKEAAATRIVFGDGTPLSHLSRSAVEFRELVCPILNDPLGRAHKIVMAQSLKMGNNSAAVAATALLSEFPRIDSVVLVGIAGGVPHLDHKGPAPSDKHVKKGDIIVSDQIVQYDMVAMMEDRSENRAKTPAPSSVLLSAVAALETEMALGRRPWDEIIAQRREHRAWQRPKKDELYDLRATPPRKMKHPRRYSPPGLSAVHRGTIGSANILLKNYIERDRLQQEYRIRAVEMEGSGVADAAWAFSAGYLVIRGVCDYCDRKKDDAWQNHAALAAAAYAKCVIQLIPF
jgi:nucleoside phosphorylase